MNTAPPPIRSRPLEPDRRDRRPRRRQHRRRHRPAPRRSRPESPGGPAWSSPRRTSFAARPPPSRWSVPTRAASARRWSASTRRPIWRLFRLADESAVPPVALGDAGAVQAGHFAIAVGRSGEGDTVASAGLVNRAGGPWQTWLGGADRSPDPPRRRRLRRLVGRARRRRLGRGDRHRDIGALAQLRHRRPGGDGLAGRRRAARPRPRRPRLARHRRAGGAARRCGTPALPLPRRRRARAACSSPRSPRAARPSVPAYASATSSSAPPAARRRAWASCARRWPSTSARLVTLAVLRGGVPLDLQAQVGEWPGERRCC